MQIARKSRQLLSFFPHWFQKSLEIDKYVHSSSLANEICDFESSQSECSNSTERELRCQLASLYRLIHLNNWCEDVLNHVTVRLPKENESESDEHFLINAFGLQYYEVTASNLVKARLSDGSIVQEGSSKKPVGLNEAGLVLHTALHKARPDVNCIVHFHQTDVQAISSLKCGLLRTSLESCILGNVSRHSFRGITVNKEEQAELARNLGSVNKVMLLDNHGAVICAETVAEAWQLTTMLVHSAKSQLTAMQAVGGNTDNLLLLDDDTAKVTYETAWSCNLKGTDITDSHKGRTWKFGERLFQSELRKLNLMGLKTGFAT